MKLVIGLLILFIISACSNPTRNVAAESSGEFTFKFNYKQEKLEIKKVAASYDAAFHEAASECFAHYTKPYNKRTPEEIGLDIIDVCANPRK